MGPTPVVSTAWLAENIGKPGVVVFDCTKYLPGEAPDGHTEFLNSHIPGARFFDIDVVADADAELPHTVPSAARFARVIGEMGVQNSDFVVFYDQKGLASAARGWWLMGLFGHDQAAVLDGGLPKWVAEGNPTEAGPPKPAEPRLFRPDFRATRLRGIGDMRANLASHEALVVDARAAGRFHGTLPEPRPGMRAGHIPGAINIPYGTLLGPDQTLLPAATLREKFAAAGIDGSRPVVTSCGSGVTATILTLAMTVAGLPAGAVYDGSWSEWGGRPDTPLET
jgi:thiosulfate/3-mercaptopyruvate sulfurtransferase